MRRLIYLFFIALLSTLSIGAQNNSCLSFDIGTASGNVGDTLCIDITVHDFNEIIGMQYSFGWDPQALEFVEFTNFSLPNLTLANFNTQSSMLAQGQSAISWFDLSNPSGLSLADGSTIYSLCFEVLAASGSEVSFAEQPTAVEVVGGSTVNLSQISFINGGIGANASGAEVAIDSICLSADACGGNQSADITVSGGQAPYTYVWEDATANVVANTEDVAGLSPGTYLVTVTDDNGNVATATSYMYVESELDIDAILTNPTCDIAQDGSIDLTVSGGSGSYSALWSNGANSLSLTNLPAGAYSVTITDDVDGCVTSQSFTLIDGNIVATITYECTIFPDTTLADITTVVWAGGTAPHIFEWSTGFVDTSMNMISTLENVADETAYSVTITNQEGCSQIQTIDPFDCGAVEGDFLVAHSYACTLFPDEPAVADLTVAIWDGGVFPHTFDWSTGEQTVADDPALPLSTVVVPGNGIYYVTITDAQGAFMEYGPMVLDCDEGGVDLNLDATVYCLTATEAAIIVTADGGTPPYTFTLSNGETAVDNQIGELMITEDGVYIVEVVDAAGNVGYIYDINAQCGLGNTDDDFLIAHAFECQIFSDTTIAEITVVVWTGGTMPYTYEWSTGEVQTISDPNLPAGTISADGHGTYYVTITDVTGNSEVYGPLSPDCGPPSGAITTFIADSDSVEEGDSFCVDVTVENFNDIVSFQYSMNWDADTIQFDSILIGSDLPFFNGTSFNLNQTDDGVLITQWFHPSVVQVSLPDETVLFSLCFTATTAGTTDLAFTSTPAVIEVTDGQSEIPSLTIDGLIEVLAPEVWPGDTDNDEGVDHFDLLNIGLAYGAVGPVRPNASIVWEGQFADDWDVTTPVSEVDYKHIDTNGDGFINAADTLAISQNWGEQSNFGAPAPIRLSNGIIYVQPDTLILGEANVFNIIMDQGGIPIEDVYGLAFTIVYDTSAVEAGSAHASFLDSWIGSDNDDMLTFYRDRYEDGRIDIAMTRIDGMNMTGEGVIGQLHITIQDVIFLRSGNYELVFDIENVRVIDYEEQTLAIAPQSTVSIIKDAVNSTNEMYTSFDFKVYPNPVTTELNLQTNAQIEAVELMTTSGQLIRRYGTVNVVDVNDLSAGIYFLRVWTNQGFTARRISVIR
jgi:hypothetical protein